MAGRFLGVAYIIILIICVCLRTNFVSEINHFILYYIVDSLDCITYIIDVGWQAVFRHFTG